MIVVFVVDTSPSMGRPVSGGSGMLRLDVAKMAVEDLSRRLRKGCVEHNGLVSGPHLRSFANIGQHPARTDALLLLSTSRQHPDTAACAVGGRMLVGFGSETPMEGREVAGPMQIESFQRELKGLHTSKWDASSGEPFPEDAGGAVGLNAALSAGLQLLSRYRLHSSCTENFGMGRLPNLAVQTGGSPATAALQPAVLILVTDGACLRHPVSAGGGSLQLQYGAQPLKEFYKEPFRWDQRVFCLAIGDYVNEKGHYLHPQLRALCEVTGGSHWLVRKPSGLPTDALMKHLRPPMPRELPLTDPLCNASGINLLPPAPTPISTPVGLTFVHGGPICCFQALEGEDGRSPVQRRAMLLYTGSPTTSTTVTNDHVTHSTLSQPLWCIPEAFFPTKKLDTLPPRSAQPLLHFSKYSSNLGSKSFEPIKLIKLLHRLDQAILTNRKLAGQPVRLLHRDVYVCEWLSPDGNKAIQVAISSRQEYFPVFCIGAGRPALSDDGGDSILNIGILHAPVNCSTLSGQTPPSRLATLTLLPPEPHILVPLLLKAAEAEHRILKKAAETNKFQRAITPLDENWRTEFQAYMFRIPPYYQHSLKRCLRNVLPGSAHPLLHTEVWDSLPLQCFSKVCLQRIRNAEQVARDTNERLERQDASLRQQIFSHPLSDQSSDRHPSLRYGQFDPRSSIESYLASLRSLSPPWRIPGGSGKCDESKLDMKSETASIISENNGESPKTVVDVLGDLPAQCLMAYYESRRRWVFGGPSLTTRGLHVEGVINDGTNSHQCGQSWNDRDECPLSMAGVGVSVMNETSTAKMGDYRERLLYSRSPVVGYGSNDAAGVAATTAADGSPVWSVDDDAMPLTFFDPRTGEFADSVQARVRSRLMVNFGNPYKEKRADSLIPEQFYSQAPSMQQGGFGSIVGSPRTPPGSPPHDSFESVEEGEAIFVRTSPARSSPKREDVEDVIPSPSAKRQRTDSVDESTTPQNDLNKDQKPSPPPRPSLMPEGQRNHSESSLEKTLTTVATEPARVSEVRAQAPVPPPPSKPALSRKAPPPPPGPPPPKPGISVSRSQIGTPYRPPPPPKPSGPPGALGKADVRRSSLVPVVANREPPTEGLSAVAATDAGPTPALSHSASAPHRGSLSGLSGPPPATQAEDPQSPDQKPQVDLPPGWMCVWSRSQRRWYFFDTKTNKSVWKWPP